MDTNNTTGKGDGVPDLRYGGLKARLHRKDNKYE
jgi:hypothetical protein